MYRIIRYVVLIGCIGLLSNSISAANSVTGAISSYHQGDFETAMFQFEQIADQISDQSDVSQAAEANFMLGKMYERGDGVLADDQIALSYYKKAAEGGYTEAEQRLQEFGSDESIVQDWYMESAWDGDIDAQYNLGYIFETGMGVQVDKARAVQWYEEAAKKQHDDAQFRLGLMLISADPASQDLVSGKFWIKTAAENGNSVAVSVVQNLFVGISDKKLIQAVSGIRTYDQSSTELMLAVVHNTIYTKTVLAKKSSSESTQPRSKQDDKQSKEKNKIVVEQARLESDNSIRVLPRTSVDSELLVVTKFSDNAEFAGIDSFRESRNYRELNDVQILEVDRAGAESFLNRVSDSRTVWFAVAVFFLLILYWRQRSRKRYRDFILSTEASAARSSAMNASSENNEDISALIERLMKNPAEEIDFKSSSSKNNAELTNKDSNRKSSKKSKHENAQVGVVADDRGKAKSKGKQKEVLIKDRSVQKHNQINVMTVPAEEIETPTIESVAIRSRLIEREPEEKGLSVNTFLPSAVSDVALKNHASNPVSVFEEAGSISLDSSHAIDESNSSDQLSIDSASTDLDKLHSHTKQVSGRESIGKKQFLEEGVEKHYEILKSQVKLEAKLEADSKDEWESVREAKQESMRETKPETKQNPNPKANSRLQTLTRPQSMSEFSDFLNDEVGFDVSDKKALAESYFNIGIMFVKGDGIAVNHVLGAHWLQKAADIGHEAAKDELEVVQELAGISGPLKASSAN